MIVPSPSSPSCTCVGSLISLRMLAALGRVARYSRPVVRRQLHPTWYARNLIGSSDGRCGSSNPGGRRASGHWRSWLAGFHEPGAKSPTARGCQRRCALKTDAVGTPRTRDAGRSAISTAAPVDGSYCCCRGTRQVSGDRLGRLQVHPPLPNRRSWPATTQTSSLTEMLT